MFNVPMLLYVAAVSLSVLAASVWLLAVFEVFMLVQAFAMFFYLANRMRTERDVVACVLMLCGSLWIQSVLTMGLAAFGSAGSTYTFGPIDLVVWDDGRPGSTVHSPVAAGSLMALMWVPVMTLALSAKRSAVRWICIVCTAVGMLAILLTQTRGAILTAAVGTGCIGCLMAQRLWLPKWSVFAAGALILLGAYPMFNVITTRVTGDDEGSAAARAHLAAIAMETIREAPIVGHGAGNCHLACQDVSSQSHVSFGVVLHHSLQVFNRVGRNGLIGSGGILVDAGQRNSARARRLVRQGIAVVGDVGFGVRRRHRWSHGAHVGRRF